MFTAPTAFRAIKQQDPQARMMADFDLSHFKYLFLAGERTDPDTLSWAENSLKIPVIDHWWQTETGWAIAANCVGLHRFDVKPGSPTKAAPGWNLAVLDETGQSVGPQKIGAIVAKLPLPPGTLPTLWQNDQRYISAYLTTFPGYYETADAGYIDEDGYVFVMARTDDIINVAGHRLSTGAMEEVIAGHPDVAECAVMGVEDSLKGQVPLGLLVLTPAWTGTMTILLKRQCSVSETPLARLQPLRKPWWCSACPKPGQVKSCGGPCGYCRQKSVQGSRHHR